MPDLEQNHQSEFMIEKIKVKPVNKKKLIRRTIITATMAVIFGTIACTTFLVLEPVISNWLYPEEEPQVQTVEFPEDEEEMSPEDMLAENIPTESPPPSPTPMPTQEPEREGVVLAEEQIYEILSLVTLDLDNYRELYNALSKYVNELNHYMVTVTAVTSHVNWLSGIQESTNQCSGVIVSENGMELMVLADYSSVMSAERLLLTFYDSTVVEAHLKQRNLDTNLAVLSVPLEDLPDEFKEEGLPIASFGYFSSINQAGVPVVAIGSPMGVSNSVGHGIVTSSAATLSMTDRNYRLIQTDIIGSQNASGALFNLQGQLIGIITVNRANSDMKNVITAYGITELQKIVEKMSNASAIAYMGIKGGDVPKETHQEYGVPYGAYVGEVELDSPAMLAGIQQGDIITGMEEETITTFMSYSNALMQMEPGQMINVVVKRQAQEEYKEMSFNIELGEVR